MRDEEAVKRVRMFSREIDVARESTGGHTHTSSGDVMHRADTASTLINYAQKPGVAEVYRDSALSYHVRAESPTLVRADSKMQFHRPRPSLSTGVGRNEEVVGLREPMTDITR